MPEPVPAPNPPAPPAYFLSLTVENFRCFKQPVTLDLSDGNGKPAFWNVLLGENGVGKTTLLKVTALLSPVCVPNQATQVIEYRSLFERMRYVVFDNAVENRKLLPKDASLSVSDLSGLINGNGKEPLIFTFKSHKDFFEATYFTQKEYPLSETPIFCYGASRTPNYSTSQPSFTEAQGYGHELLFDSEAKLINAEEWLLQANYAAQTATGAAKDRAAKRLDQVKDLVCGILPDGGVTNIRFTLDESTAVMTPRVEAETPFGWVRLRDLSLGYQAALTWMVDLAARMLSRYPDSPNPLAEPAIVLVDEIDLHLHPKWQRELIAKLRTTFPRTQFIVTAHSPLIVQADPDANIALLKRVGDHVEIENDVDYVRNFRVDQILTSDVFGLESARPPRLDAAFREREAILTKAEVTASDWERLDEIARMIGETPDGEKTGDIEAQNLVRRASRLLQGSGKQSL